MLNPKRQIRNSKEYWEYRGIQRTKRQEPGKCTTLQCGRYRVVTLQLVTSRLTYLLTSIFLPLSQPFTIHYSLLTLTTHHLPLQYSTLTLIVSLMLLSSSIASLERFLFTSNTTYPISSLVLRYWANILMW